MDQSLMGSVRPLHSSHPGVNGHRVRILPEEDIIQREQDCTEGHGEHVQDHREDSKVIHNCNAILSLRNKHFT